MRPGLALIHATGSWPTSTQVPDVELQHEVLGRVGGDHFHGALAVHRLELGLVVVIAGAQPGGAELLAALRERLGDLLPTVQVPVDRPALAITMYLAPRILFSSIALAMPSPVNALGPLWVELQRIPRSSISLRTSLAWSGVQLKYGE